jgi:hypothetical protein
MSFSLLVLALLKPDVSVTLESLSCLDELFVRQHPPSRASIVAHEQVDGEDEGGVGGDFSVGGALFAVGVL